MYLFEQIIFSVYNLRLQHDENISVFNALNIRLKLS